MPDPTIHTDNVLYYGCLGDTGHYLFTNDGKSRPDLYQKPPFTMIDGGFLAAAKAPDNPKGWVYVTRIGTAWTILSFWDRSVDSRTIHPSL